MNLLIAIQNFYGRSSVCLPIHLTNEKSSGWQYSIFLFNFIPVIISTIILCLYVRIFKVVTKSQKLFFNTKNVQKTNKVAKTALLIVLTNMICWLPISFLGKLKFLNVHSRKKIYFF